MKSYLRLVTAATLMSMSLTAIAQDSAGAVPANVQPTGDLPEGFEGGPASFNETIRSSESVNDFFTIFDGNAEDVLPNIAPFLGDGSFNGAGETVGGLNYIGNSNSIMFVLDDTGAQVDSYPTTVPPGGQTWSGFALDPVSGDVYASSTNIAGSTLFTMDVTTGTAATIGPITGSDCNIAISFDGAGNLFGYDLCSDTFMQIDPSDASISNVVPLPINANFGQGMMYDPTADSIVMLAFNGDSFQAEMWSVDTSNPASPVFNFQGVLGSTSPGGTTQLSWGGAGDGEPGELARFLVTKDFDDNNTADVEVTLSCNTGLPLQQSTSVSEGDPVNFVVGDFEQGALNCTVTEEVPTGYAATYNGGDGCTFENSSGFQYVCEISNELQESEVEVTKMWLDENPSFNPVNIAEAYWFCSNVAFFDGYGNSGYLDFYGNPGSDSFFVFPDWESGTTCYIEEVLLPDGGVEVDDSDCQGITLFPGDNASCTIYNTRLYEGIPTLSQYGLAVLALLMLGVGLVGFRRFV